MARALPPGGKLISLEYEPKHAEVARANIERAGLSGVVEVRVGEALKTLPMLESEGPFDLIFIDADKQNNAGYFQWALKLSRPGSVIVVDNVVREGEVANPDSTDERVRFFRETRGLILENVDMVPSHGVTQQTPQEENACPPAYCITPSVSSATSMSANISRRAG